MDAFAAIADERRALADLVETLTDEQLRTPSLCDAWTVRDVVGHLVVPLEVGVPGFLLAMARSGFRFDVANARLATRMARRPVPELVGVLRAKAEHRFVPPGGDELDPLVDVVVHGLDLRVPLGLDRSTPADRLRAALDRCASPRGRDPRTLLDGLRLEADDVDWAHGEGAIVRGPASALLLALTGRRALRDALHGEAAETLRGRLAARD